MSLEMPVLSGFNQGADSSRLFKNLWEEEGACDQNPPGPCRSGVRRYECDDDGDFEKDEEDDNLRRKHPLFGI